MDVHKDSYTLCCYNQESDEVRYTQKIQPTMKSVLKYIAMARQVYGEETEFVFGYEAGATGYNLYRDLSAYEFNCIILAPTSMANTKKTSVKTDKIDAENIARCLAFRLYSKVSVPTEQDEQVKEYIRMRDDQKEALKRLKQQILAFVLRMGERYAETGKKSYWTGAHLKWLRSIRFSGYTQEALDEYLLQYEYMVNKLERLDERIEEIAMTEEYAEKVSHLTCLLGVKTYTALGIIVETGDFNRFQKANQFAAFLGLVPGESSSGNTVKRTGITKSGNTHMRRLLIESAQAYCRGTIGHKSKELKRRQKGNPLEVIAYADKCNERLRRKFYRMTFQNNSPRNVAATAIARELACFMWGLMTGNIA